jgi:membrane-bound lytic murein transglycosylase D
MPARFHTRCTLGALCAMLLLISRISVGADSPFVRPAEIEPDVQFWIRVYTEVTTNGGLVHDDRKLGVVYEVMQFPANVSPRERQRLVEAAKGKYRTILRRFASGVPATTPDEQRVRALWPEGTGFHAFNEAAERVRFQLGQADRFRAGMIRAGTYEAHIAETFADMGLPAELAALPHVESSFDPTAYSKAGAAGLWQFMRSTGRRYMRIDSTVDERMDPYRSTVAAAQLLQFNYDLLGSWPLALTAYNHGAAGMRRAKEKQGTDDIVTIIRRHQSRTFGFASRNYYVAFLAALEVDRDSNRYFGALTRHPEVKTLSVALPAYVPVTALERSFGVDMPTLRQLNPALTAAVWNGDRYVPQGFVLKLPEARAATAGDLRLLLASLNAGERFDAQRADRTYRVRNGDNLSRIASASGTTVTALMRLNDLRGHQIRVGQVLQLPGSKPSGSQPSGDGVPDTRVVESGEKLPAGTVTITDLPPAGTVTITDLPPAGTVTITDLPPEAQPEERPASDRAMALAQAAEPVSEAQAEELGPALIAGAEKTAMSADPIDYSVADDDTIEVQATETLGHYADWLDVRASRLRQLNRIRYGTPVVIGHRLKIDISRVTADDFTQRRRDYHQKLQEDFFAVHRIVGTEVHVVRPGESVWAIAQKNQNLPIWLLRQYNPDVDFDAIRPRTELELPLVEMTAPASGPPAQATAPATASPTTAAAATGR